LSGSSRPSLDLGHCRIAIHETQDVAHVATVPLVDGLVVVSDHADLGPELAQSPNQHLLERIDVLILVDDEILDPFGELRAQNRIGCDRLHRLG
jgi:hypothetical protein